MKLIPSPLKPLTRLEHTSTREATEQHANVTRKAWRRTIYNRLPRSERARGKPQVLIYSKIIARRRNTGEGGQRSFASIDLDVSGKLLGTWNTRDECCDRLSRGRKVEVTQDAASALESSVWANSRKPFVITE